MPGRLVGKNVRTPTPYLLHCTYTFDGSTNATKKFQSILLKYFYKQELKKTNSFSHHSRKKLR